MKTTLFALFVFLVYPWLLQAADSTPALEKALKEGYETCRHWGGEENSSPERQKEIQEGSQRDCGAAMVQVEKAMKVKKKTPAIAGYILLIAGVSQNKPEQLARWKKLAPSLCRTAEPYMKKFDAASDVDGQSTLISLCPKFAEKFWRN